MSWNEYHSRSESLAAEAEVFARIGDRIRAEELYRAAVIAESNALKTLSPNKARTRGVTAVSAVALSYKGRDLPMAERLAHEYLAGSDLPLFAVDQLRTLLNVIWTRTDAAEAGLKFLPGDVLVAIKGGEIIHGGAPLDLILRKVEGIQAVLFRTVEMLLDKPFRKRGGPPMDVQSLFRPWLFQAPAGSYQFAVRMQEPAQGELWEAARPKTEQVTATFFRVLRAAANSPDVELPNLVIDQQYRAAFLSLSRNLAPSGKSFERLEILDASAPREPVVTLGLETRQDLNAVMHRMKPPRQPGDKSDPFAIKGVLRAVHLDQDWLEISRQGVEPEHLRIEEAGEALDDVVGPMVNRLVTVTVVRRGNKHLYRDMELDE